MSWLSGWAKRIKLTVDCVKIDANQTHFPVTVILSSVHGAGMFTELGADANRKKVAFTKVDEETQLYAEIELFDFANQKAVYHVSANGWEIASGADTDFYMYYDASQAENTTYIGDVTETPAQAVWDSGFKAVYHMAQDPNGDVANAIKDSTSNVNHGTPVGGMTSSDLVDGKIGKAIDFDGNDSILLGTDSSLDIGANDFTLEAIGMWTSGGNVAGFINIGSFTKRYALGLGYLDASKVSMGQNVADFYYNAGSGLNDENAHYIVGVGDLAGGNPIIYVDSVSKSYLTSLGGANIQANNIGRSPYGYFVGKIDEVRVSSTVRSVAWIKATYYSLWDLLLTYGEEEEAPLAPPIITEASVIFVGQIKNVSFQGVAASVNCVGFEHFLKQTIPKWRYQLTCNHMIFDSKCTKAEADYKTTTTVTLDSTGTELISADFDALEDGYFTGGKVVFGDEARTIVNHVGSVVTLIYKMKGLEDNDSVDAYPGCDGRIETCKDKFDNLINFLGFPFIPEENPALRVSW